MNIFALTSSQLVEEFRRQCGVGVHQTHAVYRAVLKRGATAFDSIPEIAKGSGLSSQFSKAFPITVPTITVVNGRDVVKFVTSLADGNVIESVIIPERGRTTLCISSQVGCRMGCTFCATGAKGFARNLTVDEIVGQVFSARFTLKSEIDNIVFMGMGEPFDNFDNVIQAIRVMSDQRGLDISYSHITVSTGGHVEGIRRLAELNFPRLRLAISLNAADESVRATLMPISRRYPLEILRESLRDFPLNKRGVFFIEYVLIAGVNDTRAMAANLAEFLKGLPVRVNLIPLNQSPLLPYVTPSPELVERFRLWLVEEDLFVRLRQPHGQGVYAACGQLGAWGGATP